MKRRQSESGAALVSAVLAMMLMSAVLVGLVAMVVADQQSLRSGDDQTQAYVAAHAGLEKLTADLGALFKSNYSPTGAQINALTDSAHTPTLSGITFVKPDGTSGYSVGFTPDANGNPAMISPTGSLINQGPYQGLIGLITPYTMDVTARTATGAEVRLTRSVQSVAIPVFQFGIFSDKDLSFHAGPTFNFGGRVHTNQNLYLAQAAGATLILGDRVTAVGEVVRSHLASGRDIAQSGHTGTVLIATTVDGCASGIASATCRALAWQSATNNEGSVLIGTGSNGLGIVPPSTLNLVNGVKEMVRVTNPAGDVLNTNSATSPWSSVSPSAYNGYLLNGVYKWDPAGQTATTSPDFPQPGARRLELPIVDSSTGATAMDLIRRPAAGNPTGPGTTYDQRFFRLASLRILLSDSAADITGLPGVTPGAPVDLSQLDAPGNPYGYPSVADNNHPPIAKSDGTLATTAGQRLITGFLKIDRQDNNGNWTDVTMEILNLGFAGRSLTNGTANVPVNPGAGSACLERSLNAVIRFERLSDTVTNCGQDPVTGNWDTTQTHYIPMALYDAREGATQESDNAGIRMGGIMHYLELDVNNLKRWLSGAIGTTGNSNTMNVTGYVVYFSDRRGNQNPAAVSPSNPTGETGELGWEDFITVNNALDTGEDVNENNAQEMYGLNIVPPQGAIATRFLAAGSGTTLRTSTDINNARGNPPAFFRRALKMVHGGRGQLPANGAQGLTVASENPVYVEGNYNACGTAYVSCGSNGFTDQPGSAHVSSSVIADAVTLLSMQWNDINSFNSPHNPAGRPAGTTWYRLAIISGKGISYPYQVFTPVEPDRGSDGGVHNFLRYLENWGGQSLNYWGSMVSLWYNRQATGVYKCCGNVYSPPTRAYKFDTDFLTPGLLPPRTPMFRDINVLTFRESFNPTEP